VRNPSFKCKITFFEEHHVQPSQPILLPRTSHQSYSLRTMSNWQFAENVLPHHGGPIFVQRTVIYPFSEAVTFNNCSVPIQFTGLVYRLMFAKIPKPYISILRFLCIPLLGCERRLHRCRSSAWVPCRQILLNSKLKLAWIGWATNMIA
jgi:hypothetical protein